MDGIKSIFQRSRTLYITMIKLSYDFITMKSDAQEFLRKQISSTIATMPMGNNS